MTPWRSAAPTVDLGDVPHQKPAYFAAEVVDHNGRPDLVRRLASMPCSARTVNDSSRRSM